MRAKRAWLWLSIAILMCLLSGCGTPGVPQPPSLNLAKPVSNLQGTRAGTQVTLTWNVPTQTTDTTAFRHRGGTQICRALNRTIDHCNAFATIATPPQKETVSFTSPLPTQNIGPGDYVSYAVEVLNERGRSAGLSNQVRIPTVMVSTLNGNPRIEVTPDAVIATASVAAREPAVPQTLELRRKEKSASQETTVAQRPLDLSAEQIGNIELHDDNFEWEKTYDYRVVLVASPQLSGGDTVPFDAASSQPIEVFVHDIFPPAIPSGLEAVFSGQLPGQPPAIDLTWNPNTERDLAGYFVYRRTQEQPETAAVKLNAQLLPAPSYRDTSIQAGNTYFYSVSAVDVRGNESKRSEETSEQVPKQD
jgi:hypothetical protein